MQRFGVTSMVAPLRRVLLRRPATSGDFAAANWRLPDPVLLARQHEQLSQLLTDLGCEVEITAAVS
jgi:dimethylargininase